MIRLIALLMAISIASCTEIESKNPAHDNQKKLFKNWVLSRCLSYIFQDKEQRQDALNTASAYLEQSTFSVEQLLSSEPLIKSFLSRKYQGSIKGTFNIKKCIDLYNSQQLDDLYKNLKK